MTLALLEPHYYQLSLSHSWSKHTNFQGIKKVISKNANQTAFRNGTCNTNWFGFQTFFQNEWGPVVNLTHGESNTTKVNGKIMLGCWFLSACWYVSLLFFIRNGLCRPSDYYIWMYDLHCDSGVGFPLPILILQCWPAMGKLQQCLEHRYLQYRWLYWNLVQRRTAMFHRFRLKRAPAAHWLTDKII